MEYLPLKSEHVTVESLDEQLKVTGIEDLHDIGAHEDDVDYEAVTPPFVAKLANMVANTSFAEYICWNEEGSSVLVKQVAQFSSYVLPKYFKHSNFTSFLRQLNMYGFYTARQGTNWREFKNELFIKDHPENFAKIKRRTGNANRPFMQPLEGLNLPQSHFTRGSVQPRSKKGQQSTSEEGSVESGDKNGRKRKKDDFKPGKTKEEIVKVLQVTCEDNRSRIDFLEERTHQLEDLVRQMSRTIHRLSHNGLPNGSTREHGHNRPHNHSADYGNSRRAQAFKHPGNYEFDPWSDTVSSPRPVFDSRSSVLSASSQSNHKSARHDHGSREPVRQSTYEQVGQTQQAASRDSSSVAQDGQQDPELDYYSDSEGLNLQANRRLGRTLSFLSDMDLSINFGEGDFGFGVGENENGNGITTSSAYGNQMVQGNPLFRGKVLPRWQDREKKSNEAKMRKRKTRRMKHSQHALWTQAQEMQETQAAEQRDSHLRNERRER